MDFFGPDMQNRTTQATQVVFIRNKVSRVLNKMKKVSILEGNLIFLVLSVKIGNFLLDFAKLSQAPASAGLSLALFPIYPATQPDLADPADPADPTGIVFFLYS